MSFSLNLFMPQIYVNRFFLLFFFFHFLYIFVFIIIIIIIIIFIIIIIIIVIVIIVVYVYVFSTCTDLAEKRTRFPQGLSLCFVLIF